MSSLPALAAAYAAEVIVATTATVPVMGEIRLLTHTLMRVEHVEVEGALLQRQEICAVASRDDTRMSETSMPPAFVASLPASLYPVSIEPLGDDAWRWRWDPGPVYVGYLPSDTDSSAPESVEDPRVVDTDHDGQPAATVRLSIPLLGDADLYTVHRNHVRMDGVMRDGVIEGSVRILGIEQLTVGASRALFAHSARVAPVSAQSSFRMWPVEAEVDCAQLAAGWTPAPHPWLQ
ncbi:MAG: hypothetical protein H6740_14285 [Alphaproteobacteria bacterium]|nr:hypothetical protein [Alphaproteobacteria bacterium]